jgi:hypothetical protein
MRIKTPNLIVLVFCTIVWWLYIFLGIHAFFLEVL